MTLQEYKERTLVRPDHFAYFGDLDQDRWGRIGFAEQTRDSDPLERSNHEVIRDDLLNRFPDAFVVEGASHWLVGWIDEIKVDTHNEEALEAALEWKNRLDDYLVADEDHYSDLGAEDALEAWESFGRLDFEGLVARLPELQWLVDPETDELNEAGEFIGERVFVDLYRESSSIDESLVDTYQYSDAVHEWKLMKRQEYEEYQLPLSED
jgi:hypothetical protein